MFVKVIKWFPTISIKLRTDMCWEKLVNLKWSLTEEDFSVRFFFLSPKKNQPPPPSSFEYCALKTFLVSFMLISSAQIGTPGLAWLVRLGRERKKILCERIRFCSGSDTTEREGVKKHWHELAHWYKVTFRKKSNVFYPNAKVSIMLSLHNNFEKTYHHDTKKLSYYSLNFWSEVFFNRLKITSF